MSLWASNGFQAPLNFASLECCCETATAFLRSRPAAGRGFDAWSTKPARGDLVRSRGRPPPRASSCPASAATAIPPRLWPPQAAPYPVSSLGAKPPRFLGRFSRRGSAVFVDCLPSFSPLCADPRSGLFPAADDPCAAASQFLGVLCRVRLTARMICADLVHRSRLVIVIARWPAGPHMNRPTACPRRLRRGATSTSKSSTPTPTATPGSTSRPSGWSAWGLPVHPRPAPPGGLLRRPGPRPRRPRAGHQARPVGRREVQLAGRRTRHASGPRSSIVPTRRGPSGLARTSRQRASAPGRGAS